MDRARIRASDADRQATAQRLAAALSEGRLDAGEYDDRLRQVYEATNHAALEELTADLPPAARQPATSQQPEPGTQPRSVARSVGPWIAGLPIGCIIIVVVVIILGKLL